MSAVTISRFVVALLALLMLVPAIADPPQRKVTVIGTAVIKVVPDEMKWTIQVSINDATLARAKARHDSSLGDVLKEIKSLGGGVTDLQTGGIRFEKNLYPGDDAEAKKNPFSCTTQITFTLTDFSQYGPVCDALAKLDGVQVQAVDYAFSKEDMTKRDALKQALINAKDKATDLAETAGCYIDKPLEIQEGASDNGPRPMFAPMGMARAAGGTPDAVAGQIEISASVTATYDLYYR